MRVLKFGGTSVGTVQSLSNVISIARDLTGDAIIVVSALGGLTDKLIATANQAASTGKTCHETVDAIAERHFNMIDALVPEDKREQLKMRIAAMISELSEVYDGISLLGEVTDRSLCRVVSFGERMSSLIVADAIPGAVHHDSLQIVKTERWFGKNIADSALTEANIRSEFENHKGIAVVGGFISTDRDTGEITNLGRGGSDYTAALIAAALDADVLDIWTDVDGFMTADPRIIPSAFVLSHMTFVESMELCSYGAKVIYPPTIYPVFHKNIPIRILNTFRPEVPGTLIDDCHKESDPPVKGVTSMRDVALISLHGDIALNVPLVTSRTVNALARKGVNVYLISSPVDERPSFTFAVSGADKDMALKTAEDEYRPELMNGGLEQVESRSGLSTVALVGEGIQSQPGLQARLVNSLLRNGIEVAASTAEGASSTTMCFVVPKESADDALRIIHASVFK